MSNKNITNKFRIIIQSLSSTKRHNNKSLNYLLKKEKEKLILNILKYSLIRNSNKWILILKGKIILKTCPSAKEKLVHNIFNIDLTWFGQTDVKGEIFFFFSFSL